MNKSIPLSEAAPRTRVTVVAIRGGGSFHERISSMGLYLGCTLEILVGGQQGRMVLAVGYTRIALGHGMAEKVWVRPAAA